MQSAYRREQQAPAQTQAHLAWHETMELHELVAYQANHLMAFKMHIKGVKDPQLNALYAETIHCLEQNLNELLPYYPKAPIETRAGTSDEMTAFHAAHLLAFAKTAVRSYAIGITETATPQLRETFRKHLNNGITLHAKIFAFMLDRGYYPAYQLDQLLANDVKNAKLAISMP